MHPGETMRPGRGWLAAVLATVAVCLWPLPAPAQEAGELTFLTTSLPDGVKGEPYQQGDPPSAIFLVATGGSPPYQYELRDGSLPAGLSLDPDGAILGTPTECGTAVFQSMVRDAAGGTAVRTFLLVVGGGPALQFPASLEPTVAAGETATVELPLVNDGCTSVRIGAETIDFGTVLPDSPPPTSEVASLLAMGAPVPRTLGRRAGNGRPRVEGLSLDGEGRLVDAEGNLAGLQRPAAAEGLVDPEAAGAAILYVNQSSTVGEVERLEDLGYLVVETQVPQALDLETLLAFDVLWLTAATDSAFPSREAVRQFVWQGGGLVIEQVQFSGTSGLLPAGYELNALTTVAPGDFNSHTFTAEGLSDPLTAGLQPDDLPSNFDTAFPADSGPRWSWLALQADQPDLGSLAVAELGGGRVVYHTGNLGQRVTPAGNNGTDAFMSRVVDRADGGFAEFSCPWLDPGRGVSDVRIDSKFVDDVLPFDESGETVRLQLPVDTAGLLPGAYSCRLHLLTSDPESLEPTVPVTLTVAEPAGPAILTRSLPAARPGIPYGATLVTAGGTPPYTFQLVGGSLPAGVSLDPAAGTLFGTPGESGIFRPVFQVTDSAGPPPGQSSTELTLTSGLVITTETLPDATIGQIYVVPIRTAGGTPPYTFTLEERLDYTLPADDPNSPAAQDCPTLDAGGGVQETSCTLANGTYRLFFNPLEGFFPPFPVDVPVPAGGTVAVTGHYTPHATIVVETNLDAALYAVLAETDFGPVDLLGAGMSTTFSELPPGDYEISFGVVQGFATPAAVQLALGEGETATVTATYVDVTGGTSAADRPRVVLDPEPGAPGPGVMPAGPVAEADIGFDSGLLVVTTDADGAGFRMIANRPLTGLGFETPGGDFGSSAALVGRMATLEFPPLEPGEEVSITVQVEDAGGNRARRSYAPRVWNLPQLLDLVPGQAALGLEFDARIQGNGLRPSSELSLGDDITLELGRTDLIGPEGPFFVAVGRVSPDAVAVARDLVYRDPELAETAAGSEFVLEEALRLFVSVGQLDVDGSGRVDGFDLAAVAAAFGSAVGDPGYSAVVDVSNDGRVDGEDLSDLAIAFGRLDLGLEADDLPPPGASFGQEYQHPIRFTGGSLFISDARVIGGDLPDGVSLALQQLVSAPQSVQDFQLLLSGIPAEAGDFTFRVQAVDAFFGIAEQEITLSVAP